MSTIATLTANESGSDSRADINNNLANLNADKVEGPSSSVDSEVALFSGTGGKTIKRASGTGVVHVTSGVASVSAVVESDITLADNTTNDVSTSKHGLVPKAPNDATKFLDGTGAYDTVKDSDLSTSDVTTNDATTSKHGFLKKLPNDATKFLDGTGNFSAPVGSVFKNGNATHDISATGAQTIAHGVGRTPLFIRITAFNKNTTSVNNLSSSVGTYNGSATACHWDVCIVSGSPTFDGGADTTNVIVHRDATDGSRHAEASIAVDGTNITLTWTKTGSPTGTINFTWEAIG